MQSAAINALRWHRAGSIRMGLACIVLLIAAFITASAQPPLGEPNEVWVSSSVGDTIYVGQVFKIQVYMANENEITHFATCLEIYSPDGASWDWIPQPHSFWYYAPPPNVISTVSDFRWWGDRIESRLGLWGPSSDSAYLLDIGGTSYTAPHGPPGGLEYAYNIHLRPTAPGTICVDSGAFPPATDMWIFSFNSTSYRPRWNGPFSFTVIEPPDVPGDINCDGSANVGDAVYLINWIFKNGPAPCR